MSNNFAPATDYHAALKSALVKIEAYKLQTLAAKQGTPINSTAFNQLVSSIEADYSLDAKTLNFKNWQLRDNFEQIEDLKKEAPFLFTPTEIEPDNKQPKNNLSPEEIKAMSGQELWDYHTEVSNGGSDGEK